MQVFFIEQSFKKCFIKAFIRKVELEDDRIIINKMPSKFNKKIKLVKEIAKILNKNNVNTVIIEEKLKSDKDLINLFYSNNINIINRKRFI